MSMTHYMALLADNQPWNLIIYMVIPVVLAEAMVATEFFMVFYRGGNQGSWRTWNKWLGVVLGFYFLGIFLNLTLTVVPGIEWRGPADILAVGLYLAGIIPLLAIAFLELGVIGKGKAEADKMKLHFILLTAYLVIAHVAMVFGMLDPQILGWHQVAPGGHTMMHHS